MLRRSAGILSIATIVVAAAAAAPSPRAAGDGGSDSAQTSTLIAPESIRIEHQEIHEALEALTRVPGAVGQAATALAEALHPHFVREEEIALPPLGLLAPLAAGKTPAGMEAAAVMSDTLRKELPRMLEEHKVIRAATAHLMKTGQQEGHAGAQAFAAELAAHARMEEEILYPAAILVGDVVRARTGKR